MPKKIWLGGKYGSVIGNYAIVDDDDFEMVNKFRWHSRKHRNTFYARRIETYAKNKVRWVELHRFITNFPKGMVVDHINHDGLDNRKENLRVCTNSQNLMNRGKDKDNTSGFKGVSWSKNAKKWVSQLRFNNKNYNLGYFKDKVEAAKAYDKASRKYHGEFAYLNFK